VVQVAAAAHQRPHLETLALLEALAVMVAV
jgi:hypothetical protein